MTEKRGCSLPGRVNCISSRCPQLLYKAAKCCADRAAWLLRAGSSEEEVDQLGNGHQALHNGVCKASVAQVDQAHKRRLQGFDLGYETSVIQLQVLAGVFTAARLRCWGRHAC